MTVLILSRMNQPKRRGHRSPRHGGLQCRPAGRGAQLCEQGLARAPGEPMLHPSAGRRAVFQERNSSRRARTSRPAWQNARQCRRTSAGRAHRPRGRGFRRRAGASRSGDRDRAATRGLSRKGPHAGPGRPSGRRRARPGGRSWTSFRSTRRPRRGSDGWHGRTATSPPPRRCSNARRKRDAPASVWFDLGLVRQDLRDYAERAAAYRKALEIKPDYAEAALNLGIVLQEAGDLDGAMRAYARGLSAASATFGTIAMALTSASRPVA